MKFLKRFFKYAVYIFALIGFSFLVMFLGVKYGITNTKGMRIDGQRKSFLAVDKRSWTETEEWKILKEAIVKDKDIINKVAKEIDLNSRIIILPLVVEQLRLYYDQREIFKSVFAPLKILGSQSQFSWGIMGIKRETAEQIEENLKNKESDFYIGEKYEKLLDFQTTDTGKERFERIIDENNHYYGYLYGSLYIKQILKQWGKAGFDISNRPEIIATLYNIGFANSKPKASPESGGSEIEIKGEKYNFGTLAKSFYDSYELLEVFPR